MAEKRQQEEETGLDLGHREATHGTLSCPDDVRVIALRVGEPDRSGRFPESGLSRASTLMCTCKHRLGGVASRRPQSSSRPFAAAAFHAVMSPLAIRDGGASRSAHDRHQRQDRKHKCPTHA